MTTDACAILMEHLAAFPPMPHERILFLNAMYHPALLMWRDQITVTQRSYREATPLTEAGLPFTHRPNEEYDVVLFLGSRYRELNLDSFYHALAVASSGGRIISSFPNEWGASRFEKLLAEVSGLPTASVSKKKCRVFEISLTPDAVRPTQPEPFRSIPGTAFVAPPGAFSANELDEASMLLVESLPHPLGGHGADLGCGYGFLGCEILKRSLELESMHFIEDDYLALEAAGINAGGDSRGIFLWCDLFSLACDRPFDFIVTNPPYHTAGDYSTSYGWRFLEAARALLAKGGKLYAVHQRGMPFERDMALHGTVTVLSQSKSFVAWEFTNQ